MNEAVTFTVAKEESWEEYYFFFLKEKCHCVGKVLRGCITALVIVHFEASLEESKRMGWDVEGITNIIKHKKLGLPQIASKAEKLVFAWSG